MDVYTFSSFLVLLAVVLLIRGDINEQFPGDFLTPYKDHYRTKRSLRFVRDCQPVYYGNVTHEEYPVSKERNTSLPFVNIRTFFHEYEEGSVKKSVLGHVSIVEDPIRTFSVLEPKDPGGCSRYVRATVQESATQRNCYLAANAGYFRTRNGACLGNILSDGRFVQSSGGIQNVNFGIRKDGTIVVGYLAEDEVVGPQTGDSQFLQLISGVVWIVRSGRIYVDESKKAECQDTEETGSMDLFAGVVSARTALGHDKQGRVVFVQIDGKTHSRGVNLYEFGRLLLKLGVVNAINLDGGGSSTTVVNGTLVNYPSDVCGDFTCARKVTTIVCAHEPDCLPKDCNGNGECQLGTCVCNRQWTGAGCDKLLCEQTNCSSNGVCTEEGCICSAGWEGEACRKACPGGRFGINCSSICLCQNGALCDGTHGYCTCMSGWIGKFCEQSCIPGTYGKDCCKLCNCSESCECHPETGQCLMGDTLIQNSTQSWLQCKLESHEEHSTEFYGSNLKIHSREKELLDEYSKMFIWFLGALGVCGVSLLANFVFIYMQCHHSTRRSLKRNRRHQLQEGESLFSPDTDEEI